MTIDIHYHLHRSITDKSAQLLVATASIRQEAATWLQLGIQAPLMTAWGQTEKNSLRANVFRVAPDSGHCSMQSALRICAKERTRSRGSALRAGRSSWQR